MTAVHRLGCALWRPEGSVIGLMLFLLYTAHVLRLSGHSYADDTCI